jgi:c-di-GMP-binding flagellar brake protein YcgR
MKEKREYVRLDLNVRVDWKKISETSDPAEEFTDKTKNISVGGLCLIVNEKLNVGDSLQIALELPSKKIIDMEGRVMWINEYEIFGKEEEQFYDVGIEFMNISKDEREEIKEFVLTSYSTEEEQ